jgi:hypothetical protein
VVALDVEWTNNYQIKNGSRPFCYSLVLLRWPQDGDDLSMYPASFGFKSVYVTQEGDEVALIAALDSDLQAWLASDSVLAGHQLSSDLSVVNNAYTKTLSGLEGPTRYGAPDVAKTHVFSILATMSIIYRSALAVGWLTSVAM